MGYLILGIAMVISGVALLVYTVNEVRPRRPLRNRNR